MRTPNEDSALAMVTEFMSDRGIDCHLIDSTTIPSWRDESGTTLALRLSKAGRLIGYGATSISRRAWYQEPLVRNDESAGDDICIVRRRIEIDNRRAMTIFDAIDADRSLYNIHVLVRPFGSEDLIDLGIALTGCDETVEGPPVTFRPPPQDPEERLRRVDVFLWFDHHGYQGARYFPGDRATAACKLLKLPE